MFNKDEAFQRISEIAGSGFSITILENSINEKFLLGILNSNLLFWILEKLSNVFRGGWITCTKQYFANIPIKRIHFNDKKEKSLHDEIVKLVDTMLQLNKQLQEATLPHQQEQLKQRIAFTR
jgi:signal transduction histidine kinase